MRHKKHAFYPLGRGLGGKVGKALVSRAGGQWFESRPRQGFSPGVNFKNCVRLCWGCVLGKGTLPPFPTPSDESINRGLVCVARIPSNTDFKDPDAHVLDGWVPATVTHVPSMHTTSRSRNAATYVVENKKRSYTHFLLSTGRTQKV